MMQNSPCCPRTLGYPPQVPIWSWRGCALSMPRQAPFQGHIPRCLVEGCGGLHRNGNTLLSWKEGALAYQAWDNHQGVESSHASPSLGWALLCDPPKVSAAL